MAMMGIMASHLKILRKPSPKSMLQDSTPEMKEKLWARNLNVSS
jgi:hypothetical protein